MRTKEEVDRQIDGLKKMKSTVPEFSKFGDNNWEKINAQLDVLEDLKEPDDFYIGHNDVYNAAVEAEEWMNGEDNEDLFEE